MKKLFILLSIVSFSYTTKAQVGIGTTTPEADLDIRTSNATSPTAYAGIAVPQVDVLPVSGRRAGQLVFLTTTKLYYYYNGTSWTKLVTDNWSSTGNSGTTAGTNFVGTTDNVDFVAKTNNTERVRITKEGALNLKNGHIKSEGTAPTGSGDIGTVTLSTDSTNTKGKITATTPLITLGGSTITITFAGNDTAFSIAPTVVVTPTNSTTASKNYYISNTSTSSFSITIYSSLSLNTTYEFNYMVIE